MAPRDHSTRKLCKICNTWIPDNRVQREQHENGRGHKAARTRLLKEIAKKNELASNRSTAISSAAQQMLERATAATFPKPSTNAESVAAPVVVPAEPVDEHGYPLPAEQVYQWTTVDPPVEEADIPNEELGEFAPDGGESVEYPNAGEDRDVGVSEPDAPAPTVIAESNARDDEEKAKEREELSQTETAFKKRKLSNRRRERKNRKQVPRDT